MLSWGGGEDQAYHSHVTGRLHLFFFFSFIGLIYTTAFLRIPQMRYKL